MIKLWDKKRKKTTHNCPKPARELDYHVFITPEYSMGELQMETFLSNTLLLLPILRISVLMTSYTTFHFSLSITSLKALLKVIKEQLVQDTQEAGILRRQSEIHRI